ncbi:MAG: DUF262 domain-containing protein [Pyrinomonadaceae bacterium]
MQNKNKSSELADRLFPEKSAGDVNLDILNVPPEKRRLNTETYDFTVSTLVDYLNNEHIAIPEFQRGYVWNRSQASRLIESLIINCPIPVVFLSQNADETLSVIDGNQRLNSIRLFVHNDYPLKGLNAYPELEGFYFDELDPRFQRHIQNRTIRCIVILKDTHPQIKFDVFERLNTGSVKLNDQELRHGIYTGLFMDRLEALGKNKDFLMLTRLKNNKRMKSDELALRFFALSNGWKQYTKPMVTFLNNYCSESRNINERALQELENGFTDTLEKISYVLERYSFKTYDRTNKNIKFNAALYDAQMVAFFELKLTSKQIDKLKRIDLIAKNSDFINGERFEKFISQATTDKNAVIGRIRGYKQFISNQL